MGRHKKTDAALLLQITERYFAKEAGGDASKLKCSLLEAYSERNGLPYKAYEFRRCSEVRDRLAEMAQTLLTCPDAGDAIGYKTLDIDGILLHCSDLEELKAIISEADHRWKAVYDRMAAQKKENHLLLCEKVQLQDELKKQKGETEGLKLQLVQIERKNREYLREIRYLKRMLNTYLNPAIANEVLRQKDLPHEDNVSVLPTAFSDLLDSEIPSPFSGMQDNPATLPSRQERLFEKMKQQVHDDE